MTILDTIIEHKQMEVLKRKGKKPLQQLKKMRYYQRTSIDPLQYFRLGKPGIIAEFKRKSPSKGLISDIDDPLSVVSSYKDAGAVASSILTDRDFFGGSFKDLEMVRDGIGSFPLLRKDFMIDTYQVHEAKAYGADIILLIASVLEKRLVKELTELALSLGLTVLLEVHTEEEIEKWYPGIGMLGVNNRDLRDFSVDVTRSVNLFSKLPKEVISVSESGLQEATDIKMLYDTGYRGFLIGEKFMRANDPGAELAGFINRINPQ